MISEIETFSEQKADWVTISSDEYESMKFTLEVLSDSELFEQIKESRKDYNSGKFKKLRDINNRNFIDYPLNFIRDNDLILHTSHIVSVYI